MNKYTVAMTRSYITYRKAYVTVEAEDEHEAAKIAEKMDLEWLDEDDALDEGPVDLRSEFRQRANSLLAGRLITESV